MLKDNLVEIAVTYNGTWSKKGLTANYGFRFVTSVETGQVLDYSFRSKTCTACSKQKADKESAEYRDHKEHCAIKYDGSSGNMEVLMANELWECCLKFNMQYKYMLCDGDSKAYLAVWDVYGSCKTCNTYERIDR